MSSMKKLYQYILWKDTTMQRRTVFLQEDMRAIKQEVFVKSVGKGQLLCYGKCHDEATKSGSRKHSALTDIFLVDFNNLTTKWVHFTMIEKDINLLIRKKMASDTSSVEDEINLIMSKESTKKKKKCGVEQTSPSTLQGQIVSPLDTDSIEGPEVTRGVSRMSAFQMCESTNITFEEILEQHFVEGTRVFLTKNIAETLLTLGFDDNFCNSLFGVNVEDWGIIGKLMELTHKCGNLKFTLKIFAFFLGLVIENVFVFARTKETGYVQWLKLLEADFNVIQPVICDEFEYYLTAIIKGNTDPQLKIAVKECKSKFMWNDAIEQKIEILNFTYGMFLF
ncbi:hypothetical protein EIN_409760 [Entamoeba invadens IP1]|uniref:Uncharacterized protein n=1 Tax=Entamoeba invadens IP1 TaxID=370355 RepID=A0A0A1TWS3_ENTIV|nr:hypothetical protein EIN_409760 [Entamoeba invadens IP1]ELP85657.1 hypothetical protein EIN_409760 [Entamoeba invadens IP1]|eukprot:XP_004185003.1 hypothetical protein EIN_409760 [Entamoeba invadens IP1]